MKWLKIYRKLRWLLIILTLFGIFRVVLTHIRYSEYNNEKAELTQMVRRLEFMKNGSSFKSDTIPELQNIKIEYQTKLAECIADEKSN